MPIAARKLRNSELLTPALLQSSMRKIFSKKNDFGQASFEELLPELARFNIKTRGQFVAFMTHHRRRLLRIDNEPLDAWHERYYRSELGDKFVSDAIRRQYWFVSQTGSSSSPEPAPASARPRLAASRRRARAWCSPATSRPSSTGWRATCHRRTPDGVERLHIVDGCQALDLSVGAKYERNLGDQPEVRPIRDGASFEKLGTLRSGFVEPALGMQRLVLWAVATLLFGNSDSHGKNISFFVDRTGLTPTPRYDLVSVVQYAAFHHDLAMAFGDEFKQEAPAQAADTAYTWEEVAFVRGLAQFVANRAQALLAMARDIPKFTADNFWLSTSQDQSRRPLQHCHGQRQPPERG